MANIRYSQVEAYLDLQPLTRVGREKKTETCNEIISLLRKSVFEKSRSVNWMLGEALLPYKGDKLLLKNFLIFCFGGSSAFAIIRSYDQRRKTQHV